MKCPNCKSEDIRTYYVDDLLNELSESEVNDLTTHEKEIAEQCTCNDCGYTDASDYFKKDERFAPSWFETLPEIFNPA